MNICTDENELVYDYNFGGLKNCCWREVINETDNVILSTLFENLGDYYNIVNCPFCKSFHESSKIANVSGYSRYHNPEKSESNRSLCWYLDNKRPTKLSELLYQEWPANITDETAG